MRLTLINSAGERHQIDDFWDFNLDPIAVSGINFFSQESRTLKCSFLVDTWIEQTINNHPANTYLGYVRVCAILESSRPEQTWYVGWLPGTNFSIQEHRSNLKEITATFVDLLRVLKDFSENLTKPLVEFESYQTISEIVTGLNTIIYNKRAFFEPFYLPMVINQYEGVNWTPNLVTDMVIFDRSEHDYQETFDTYFGVDPIDRRVLRIDRTAGKLILTYVHYKAWLSYLYTPETSQNPENYLIGKNEKVLWGIYQINGTNLISQLPGGVFTKEVVRNTAEVFMRHASGNTEWHNQNEQSVQQWFDSLPWLGSGYGLPWDDNSQTLFISGQTQWRVIDGTVEFSGDIAFTDVRAAETKDLPLWEWISALIKILNAYLKIEAYSIRVVDRKKQDPMYGLPVYNIDINPDDLIGIPKINGNYVTKNEFSTDLSFLNQGDVISTAINNYYIAAMNNVYRYKVEIVLRGKHLDVPTFYRHNYYWILATDADYNIDADQTAIKGLAVESQPL